jgi:hypothetical protein
MTPLQLLTYYANLLILQYLQKPKAYATAQALSSQAILPQTTVQSLSFTGTPASGTFLLNWTPNGISQATTTSAAINWNDSASQVQTKIQAMTGLSGLTVAGSIPAGLSVTFTGVIPVAPLFVVSANSLATSGAVAVPIAVAQTDVVLPLAVANGFNINSALGAVAVGSQLNILGKYAGVTRIGNLTAGQITLSDADFLVLIQFAALKNSAGSDLKTIQTLINQFFPGEILVFDYQNMQMSYLISSSVGSQNLVRVLVVEGLLFRPMGVSSGLPIYNPTITTFFGFRTYTIVTINNTPFNSYTSYQSNGPWLSYAMALTN